MPLQPVRYVPSVRDHPADTMLALDYTIDDDDTPVTRDPPTLPPHLRHIILNSVRVPAVFAFRWRPLTRSAPLSAPQSMPAEVCHTLPTPQHVQLNHLYCTTIADRLMVQAVTVRYKAKAVTTVFYSALPQVGCVSKLTCVRCVGQRQQPHGLGGWPVQAQSEILATSQGLLQALPSPTNTADADVPMAGLTPLNAQQQ